MKMVSNRFRMMDSDRDFGSRYDGPPSRSRDYDAPPSRYSGEKFSSYSDRYGRKIVIERYSTRQI